MNAKESELLLLILAETRRVEGLSPYRDAGDVPQEWATRSMALTDLKSGLGVRVSGNWLGTDAASRKARQRGLETLELAGLVELHSAWGDKRTHAMLTREGRSNAESLAIERVLL